MTDTAEYETEDETDEPATDEYETEETATDESATTTNDEIAKNVAEPPSLFTRLGF